MLKVTEDIAFTSNVNGDFIIVGFFFVEVLLTCSDHCCLRRVAGVRQLSKTTHDYFHAVAFSRHPKCCPEGRLTQIHFLELASAAPFLTNTVLYQ